MQDGEDLPSRADASLVSIVIPVYNHLDYTRRCLASIEHLTYPNFETIVVDNGSSDGTAEAVTREFPRVKVIRNPSNLGYAGGSNTGIRQSNGEFVLVLNNDTKVVDPGLLEGVVRAFGADPNVGLVTPRMVEYEDYDRIRFEGDADAYRNYEISGAAPTFRRRALEEVGLFDEFFFCYFEDKDLFARLRKAGWGYAHVPRARVAHVVGVTGVLGSPFVVYWSTRNFFVFVRRHVTLRRFSGRTLPRWVRLTGFFVCRSLKHRDWPSLRAWGRGLRDGVNAALSDRGRTAIQPVKIETNRS